ncbi:ABC transport system ATP-binding protein [Aulographum hederae CBS 113979]|uniref:ABC transport system ATP-binding protein n=1 Tax=Aulographum hederae CBS 113979 TaxID=1176131 RepID=A0A6G1H6J8_9PEZI|nr:ABC transport system ATP-binding protein [Aulographum hederae CBS 113979]
MSSQNVPRRAWNSIGNGALFSTIIRPARPHATPSIVPTSFSRAFADRAALLPFAIQPRPLSLSSARQSPIARRISSSRILAEARQVPYKHERENKNSEPDEQDDDDEPGFAKSEKASQAAQLNLSARLSKDGASKGNGGFSEVWRLLKIAAPEKKPLSWALLLLVISSGVTMSVPFSIGKILDIATKPDADTLFGLDLTTFYMVLGGVIAVGACANYSRIIILRIVGERIVTRLRSQLFKRTFIQNAEFFDANRVGDLISRLGSDTIIVGKSITQNLSDGARAFVSGVAGLSLMMYVSLKLSTILAFMFPPVAIGAAIYGSVIRNISRNIQKNLGTLTKVAEERLGNVRTSQAFAGEIQEVSRYNAQVRKIFELGKKEAYASATFYGATGFMGNATVLALLYVGGNMVKNGDITIGELSSFLMYTAYTGSSMFGLTGFFSELMKGVGAASRLFELQDRKPSMSPTKGDPVPDAKGPIAFKDVSFSYPTRPAVSIFNGLTLTIEQGSNVAIVAGSGAGKSTIASLLLRFYTPNSGEITINGKNISDMNAKQLRRRIGYVGQEPVLFSGSIAENIAYGRPLATKNEIIKAAREANCQFISDFPDGLETHVGARGTQLSGGQKQRIAIARALLKQPDILILDEATSALDAESETLVNAALGNLLEAKNTTISIAHRLSTIKRSDLIVVIGNDGKVAETGTFRELSSKDEGAFKRLMEWQLSGDGEPPVKRIRDGVITEAEELSAGIHDVDDEDVVMEEIEKKKDP